MSDGPNTRPVGLRERKKARTRDAIQRHALRLFAEQGYEATTIEQIAEAAEVSASTFFRYFPTKEAVVLTDDYEPLILAAFCGQPADLPPVRALRKAVREVSDGFGEQERAAIRERWRLSVAVPQIRAAALLNVTSGMNAIAEALARRAGRQAPDFTDRTVAGALVGVWMSALFHWGEHPEEDVVATIDRAMELMEGAMPDYR